MTMTGAGASTAIELCRKCGHRKDSHAVTPDGYCCSRCKCKRRFWR